MNERRTLLKMLETLLVDTQSISQRGAGYYSTGPFVKKYNSLLARAKDMFKGESSLLETLDSVDDISSTDPSDKMKATQAVLIEIGQLKSFIECCLADEDEKED
ncbi:hypothetical protein ACFL1X_07540 [Candidatus Hydrogenedentota bacterium]